MSAVSRRHISSAHISLDWIMAGDDRSKSPDRRVSKHQTKEALSSID